MVEIRIVNGVAAVHPDGEFKVVRRGQTATIAEDEAAELVGLGVAVYTKEPVLVDKTPKNDVAEDADIVPKEKSEPAESAPEGLKTPDGIESHLDAEDLQEMTYANLKKLATDMGLPVNKLRSKQALIDALVQEPVYVDPDDEAPPDIEAEGPVT